MTYEVVGLDVGVELLNVLREDETDSVELWELLEEAAFEEITLFHALIEEGVVENENILELGNLLKSVLELEPVVF